MTRKALRITMLAGGILAALVILLSQTFRQETANYLSKAKTESSQEPKEEKTYIASPGDAIVSPPAAEKPVTEPSLICEILIDDADTPFFDSGLIVRAFLKTLFRTVISPQAP